MTCPICQSPYAIYLGQLGTLEYHRCQDCGAEYHTGEHVEEEEE